MYEQLGTELIVAAGNDGVARCLTASSASQWSQDLRRLSCSQDSLSAAPAVQLRRLSDAAFQSARPDDLVFVVTDYGCGTSTANVLFAIYGSSGAVANLSTS